MHDAIYLTTDEITKIHKLHLEGGLAQIRDRFIVGCVTGMRYSDYSRFNIAHVQNGIINILTKKTNRKVATPAHKYIYDIIRRNKGALPEAHTLRYYNMALRQIGLKAKINQPIYVEKVKVQASGQQIAASDLISGISVEEQPQERIIETVTVPKFELITTHTARRSFATNAYLAGIPVKRIMLMTGHSTESSFFGYIRIAALENAQELKSHPFFTPVKKNRRMVEG